MSHASSSRRTSQVHIGGRCELKCPVCDCRDYREERDLERRLAGGGRRLTVRGSAANNPLFFEVVERAKASGFAEINCHTSGLGFDDPKWLAAFTGCGVTDVTVPLFAADARVHDRVAGVEGALVRTLVGLRALQSAHVGIEIEVPLLSPRIQDISAVVALAHRAVPTLRAMRFYVPLRALPAVLAPPPWDVGGARLAEALTQCEQLKIPSVVQTNDAIPLCALRDAPDLHRLYRFDPRGRATLPGGQKEGPCASCAARRQCPGVVESYRAAHGTEGIVPYVRRPRQLFEQRTTPGRVWTEDQRRAARAAELLVLRPTVNCNQDCPFCSANESSSNVWTDPTVMVRQIARAARRGIPRVSFGGGEPTLSKHLVSFVRVAARAGMPEVEIVSNGALLDRKERVDELVTAGLTDAFISLHGHSEQLSRMMTHKVGDFERTVKAIHHLLDGGVRVVLNHVIGARNYRYLTTYVEFVRAEFGGRVGVSMAFMTPQFKALTNIDLVPRISDVMPYLKRAMYRALDLEQSVHIGARQGIPPCLLGEFRGWSDLLSTCDTGISEDQPQKQRGPRCGDCQYTNLCTGLWKPYVARYGLEELVPVPGAPLTFEDTRRLRSGRTKPFSFDAFPDELRSPELETGPPPVPPSEEPSSAFQITRSRPLRVALIGTGQRARRFATDCAGLQGITIDAVVSPHAPDGDLAAFGHAPAYRDVADALETMRPDALIVASATHAHAEAVHEAVRRRIPVLVEKPATRTIAEAEELLAAVDASGGLVSVAHNVLYAAGLGDLMRAVPAPTRVSLVSRTRPTADSALRTWHAEGLYQSLYHVVALATRCARARGARVASVQFQGDARPELLRVTLAYDGCTAELVVDSRSAGEELNLTLEGSQGTSGGWRRAGAEVAVRAGGSAWTPVERRGNEIAQMVAAFVEAIDGGAAPPVALSEGVDVMRTTSAIIAALEAAGAPFSDAIGPKHVASKPLVVEHHRPARRHPPA